MRAGAVAGWGSSRAHQGGLREVTVVKQTGLPLPSCRGPPFHFSLWKEGSRGMGKGGS